MSGLAAIVATLGGTLYDAGRRALVPGPGHGPGDRSVSLTVADNGRLLIHCFSPRDDWRAVHAHLRAHGLLDGHAWPAVDGVTPPPAARRDNDRRRRAQQIWDEGLPIKNTLAARYLARRGLESAPASSLRFHPRATSLEDRERRPALLAAISDPAGTLQGVQITLLNSHAEKAALATPRRVVGALLGGAVRLGAARDDVLVLAEGVETALSASIALENPAWAALSAWNLAHFSHLPRLDRLLIAADNGAPGLDAAAALTVALQSSHPRLVTTIKPPPAPHADWNDWLRSCR